MSIDIKNVSQMPPRNPSEGRGVGENRADGDTRGPQGARATGGDQVTLTDTARRLSELTQTVTAQPVVDRSRVDEIRAAIADGSYRVNPEQIAAKLLQTEKEL
jgi:negative regulator of flagellin synthesis FlgM